MIRKVYERGRVRKTQYAQNDDGDWYHRATGGKRMASRWSRCRDGWAPDLGAYEIKEIEINLPR